MKIKFLFPFLLIFAISCNQESEINQKNIVGIWNASEFNANVQNLSSEDRTAGEKEFLSSIYTLNDDQTLQIQSDYFKNGVSGQWDLDPKTKEISMLYNYDSTAALEKYIVTYLSKKKLILRQEINANEYKGWVEITFEK